MRAEHENPKKMSKKMSKKMMISIKKMSKKLRLKISKKYLGYIISMSSMANVSNGLNASSSSVSSNPSYSIVFYISDYDYLKQQTINYSDHGELKKYLNHGYTAYLKVDKNQANDGIYNLLKLLRILDSVGEDKRIEYTARQSDQKYKVNQLQDKLYICQKTAYLLSFDNYKNINEEIATEEHRLGFICSKLSDCEFLEEITEKIFKSISEAIFEGVEKGKITREEHLKTNIQEETIKRLDYIFDYAKQISIVDNSLLKENDIADEWNLINKYSYQIKSIFNYKYPLYDEKELEEKELKEGSDTESDTEDEENENCSICDLDDNECSCKCDYCHEKGDKCHCDLMMLNDIKDLKETIEDKNNEIDNLQEKITELDNKFEVVQTVKDDAIKQRKIQLKKMRATNKKYREKTTKKQDELYNIIKNLQKTVEDLKEEKETLRNVTVCDNFLIEKMKQQFKDDKITNDSALTNWKKRSDTQLEEIEKLKKLNETAQKFIMEQIQQKFN